MTHRYPGCSTQRLGPIESANRSVHQGRSPFDRLDGARSRRPPAIARDKKAAPLESCTLSSGAHLVLFFARIPVLEMAAFARVVEVLSRLEQIVNVLL